MLSAQILSDDELECRIDREYRNLCAAQTPAERMVAWREFARLVNLRSPARVEQMEREAGLH